jgi:hypothetical protein
LLVAEFVDNAEMTLGAANSIFQLAVGVNAVIPVLLSGLRSARAAAADTMLRKISEQFTEFKLEEQSGNIVWDRVSERD